LRGFRAFSTRGGRECSKTFSSAEGEILDSVEYRNESKVLMDKMDTAVEVDVRAGVRAVDPSENFDQRGLSTAVVAHQANDFAGVQRQIDVV
jgi:hypothetical protein